MSRRSLTAGLVVAASCCVTVFAQTGGPAVSTTIDADVLRDLPTSDDIFSILETTQPSLISDRFSGAGLYPGQAARIGGFQSSWSQTLYRIGDINLSDPTGSGAPLLLPDLGLWQHIDVTTGMMPVEINAPGVSVTLAPLRPATKWTMTLSGAAGVPAPAPTAGPPPVARLDEWTRASAIASGPLLTDAQGVARLSGVFGASWTRGSQFDGAEPATADSTLGSGFAQLLFTPNDRNEIQMIEWVQKSTYPFDERDAFNQPNATTDDSASHVQASWERRDGGAPRFRVFGGYTERWRTPDYTASTGAVFDQLTDGTPSPLAFVSQNTVSQWTVGLRVPAVVSRGVHSIQAGVDVGGAQDHSSAFFSGAAGELVDGIPARVWVFNAPTAASVRHETTVDAYGSDHITLTPRLVIDAGLRFDGVSGSAEGSQSAVGWRSWLPRLDVRWAIAKTSAVFAGYNRTAYRLPLDLLAVGDPGAPTAEVFQWLAPPGGTPSLASTGALIARTGPGSGGNATFSTIDPSLRRPTTDEITVGFEAHPSAAVQLRLAGFLRRESNLLGLVDTGTAASAYSVTGLPDPGLQLLNPADAQVLPVYNRLPSSFGQDRYVLTNPSEEAANSGSLEISGNLNTGRLVLFGGATANASVGPASSVGFGPLENDQDLIGDLFVDPNANTFARGRLFTDRAFTVKLSGVLRLPSDIHLGVIARYQDGQPFSRIVVVPGLNQGAEAIRAFPDGESRFTFTETIDARLQKGFSVGNDRLDLVVDVFNLLNMSNEVEEQTVFNSTFRAATAIQPPRTFHAGVRIVF